MALIRDGVAGTETAPAEDGGGDGRAKFISRRDRTLSTIVLAIEPSLLYLIGDPEDPVTVWKKLQDQFQKKTWATTLAKIEGRRVGSRAYQDHDGVVQRVSYCRRCYRGVR